MVKEDLSEIAVEYGRGISAGLIKEIGRYLLVTMADLRQKALATLDPHREINIPCYLVHSLEQEELETDLNKLPEAETVVGLGGGAAIDAAKYFAWQKKLPLYLVPSAASVDAVFTPAVALRRKGAVFYAGTIKPEKVLIDYELIKSAPPPINRGGLGDLLSCHTALYDWQMAAAAGYEPTWDKNLATETGAILEKLLAQTAAIRAVTEEAIFNLMESYRWVARMERLHGHCRFEEGSEHFLAYNLEFITRRQFLHGPLVCLGVVIMAYLQENDPDKAWAAVEQAGVDISLPALKLSFADIEEALLSLSSFAERNRLPYSVINQRPVTRLFLVSLQNFMKERALL